MPIYTVIGQTSANIVQNAPNTKDYVTLFALPGVGYTPAFCSVNIVVKAIVFDNQAVYVGVQGSVTQNRIVGSKNPTYYPSVMYAHKAPFTARPSSGMKVLRTGDVYVYANQTAILGYYGWGISALGATPPDMGTINTTDLNTYMWSRGFANIGTLNTFTAASTGQNDAIIYIGGTGNYEGAYLYPEAVPIILYNIRKWLTPPPPPSNASITPSLIDVAEQDLIRPNLLWSVVSNATGYNSYFIRRNNGVELNATSTLNMGNTTSYPVNPFRVEYMDKDELHGWIQSYNLGGAGAWKPNSGRISADPLITRYYERYSYAPTDAYLMGRRGKNLISFRGEQSTLFFTGWSEGSYPIDYFILKREDGREWKFWKRDVQTSGAYNTISLFIDKVVKPNSILWYELQAWNTKGRPVYMKNGEWFRWDIRHWGCAISVKDHDGRWREGIGWIFTPQGWRLGDACYVFDGTKWLPQ